MQHHQSAHVFFPLFPSRIKAACSGGAYVEGTESAPVLVKGLVVVLNKLLCSRSDRQGRVLLMPPLITRGLGVILDAWYFGTYEQCLRSLVFFEQRLLAAVKCKRAGEMVCARENSPAILSDIGYYRSKPHKSN